VEAIKAHKTAVQIAQMFGVHPTQGGGWKKQALAGLPDIFGDGREQLRQRADTEKDERYKRIFALHVSNIDDKSDKTPTAHRSSIKREDHRERRVLAIAITP
jgi:hypothetical protein